jgi:uncharacterized protein (DUF1800 family)
MHGALDAMGQILFQPPSVKGWTSGQGWLTSASVVERLRAAQRIAAIAPSAALDGLEERAFAGTVPPALEQHLAPLAGSARAAAALGSPEFQLA